MGFRKFCKEAKELARERGYRGVKFVGEWRGFLVFEPYYGKWGKAIVGPPVVVLCNKEFCRMSSVEEGVLAQGELG
jgi:hypothetical protein